MGIYFDQNNKNNGILWTATETNASNGNDCQIVHDLDNVQTTNDDKHFGFSVRCVKDV
jgi:uncharacterized protein (TIGR02145 family)